MHERKQPENSVFFERISHDPILRSLLDSRLEPEYRVAPPHFKRKVRQGLSSPASASFADFSLIKAKPPKEFLWKA